jgi:hypothetical protein
MLLLQGVLSVPTCLPDAAVCAYCCSLHDVLSTIFCRPLSAAALACCCCLLQTCVPAARCPAAVFDCHLLLTTDEVEAWSIVGARPAQHNASLGALLCTPALICGCVDLPGLVSCCLPRQIPIAVLREFNLYGTQPGRLKR